MPGLPKLNFGQMGYSHNNVFIYAMELKDSLNVTQKYDTLGLFISNYKLTDEPENKSVEWEFLSTNKNGLYYVPIERMTGSSSPTNTFNDTVFFLHPPRFDYLTILQFCPYPLFRNLNSLGKQWKWDFVIGAGWLNDYFTSQETYKVGYTFTDTLRLNTNFGEQFCYKVSATSSSKFGTSKATYLLNQAYGIISFDVEDVFKRKYNFTLLKKGRVYDLMDNNSDFMQHRNKKTSLQNPIY